MHVWQTSKKSLASIFVHETMLKTGVLMLTLDEVHREGLNRQYMASVPQVLGTFLRCSFAPAMLESRYLTTVSMS